MIFNSKRRAEHITWRVQGLRHGKARTRRGQALVPVIFVMLILTVVGVAFSISARSAARSSGNYVAQMQRNYAARGALNYAMSALAQSSNNGATYGTVPPLPDTDSNGWAQLGDAWVKVEVVDTGACINLNTVTLAALQRMPVFRDNPDLANAVIQWRTPQNGQTTGTTGATGTSGSNSASSSASSGSSADDPYQGLATPYAVKGANFDTVEELLLIQGMTPTLLYGSPAGTPISAQDAESDSAAAGNSGSASPVSRTASRGALQTSRGALRSRQGASAGTGGGTGGTGTTSGATTTAAPAEDFSDIYTDSKTVLASLFTTVARERNVATDGTPRLNMNTATAQDMQDQLGLTAQEANGVIRYRTPAGNTGGGNTGGNGNGTGGAGAGTGGAGTGGTGAGARPGTGATAGGGATVPGGAGARSAISSRRSRQAAGAAGGGATVPGGAGATAGTGNSGGSTGGTAGGTTQTQTFKSIADLLGVPAFTRTVLQRVADKVSVDDKEFHENVVNINTAPAEVLATVPGMTHTILNAILTYRQNGQAFQDLGDLFSIQDLQRTDFQAIVSGLTTRTTTYYVHIKVRTPDQQSVYAVSALVELADNGPHVLQWRETERAPGWSTWVTPPTLPAPTPGQNASGTASAQ